MKQIFVRMFFLCVGFVLLSCEPSDNDMQEEDANALDGFQIATDVYDNQKGLAFIRADQPMGCHAKYNGAIAGILQKQGEWEKQYSSKRIVSISAVSSLNSCGGHTVLVEMFIRYEPRHETES